jgi:hypothetical protein
MSLALHDFVHAVGNVCNGIECGSVRVEVDFIPQLDHMAKGIVAMLFDLRKLAVQHSASIWRH